MAPEKLDPDEDDNGEVIRDSKIMPLEEETVDGDLGDSLDMYICIHMRDKGIYSRNM